MILLKNTLSDFGENLALLGISVIAFNEELQIEYINACTSKMLNLQHDSSLLGLSVVSFFNKLSIPLFSNLEITDSAVVLINCHFQKWQKIVILADDRKYNLLIGQIIASKDVFLQKLQISEKDSNQNNDLINIGKIIENLPELVYWKDKNCVYQGCNKHVAELLGLACPEDIIGKTDYDFHWSPERIKELQDADNDIIYKGIDSVVEDVIPVNGEERIFLTSKTALRDTDGNIIGILGISSDITTLKKMKKKVEDAKNKVELASKAKSDFIANMSHDIRVPLAGILGLIQELINTADDTDEILPQIALTNDIEAKEKCLLLLNQFIKKIQEEGGLLLGCADELLQFLNEILETMRLDSGKLSEEAKSFNLRELLAHNIELNMPTARHKKLQLTCEVEEAIPVYFHGIRHYLDRTILNMLSNGLKFTKDGFVKLKVEIAGEKRPNYSLGDKINLKITIQDSGMGIPKDKFQTIFENFSRLTPSYQGSYKGAGLGLYTVSKYIESMNAKIKVESEVGKGSSFIINVPLIVSDHADQEKTSYRSTKIHRPLVVKEFSPSKPIKIKEQPKDADIVKILVVEDNSIAARVAVSLIERLYSCCSCDIAKEGKQAIEMVKNNKYDLIFMDIGLCDGDDGIVVTRKIRALGNPHAEQVPIIALTGHASDVETREKILAAGLQDIFVKPLAEAILRSILQKYVLKRI